MLTINYKALLALTLVLAVFVCINDFYYNRTGQALLFGPRVALSKPDGTQSFALTLVVTPASARVRIMNIVSPYQPGMLLPAGRYDIEISSPNYTTQRFWLQHSKQTYKKIVMER